MKSILDGLRGLGAARLAAMGLVSLGMLCMIALLAFHGGGDGRMALLYGDLDMRETGEMADLLDKAHIPHQVDGQGDQILVPVAEVSTARLLLARSNLPSEGSIGYEIFDRSDSLTSSEFQQEINQTRALEGELARSIRMIDGVRGARVHLVMPHRDLFATEQLPAQASVLLTMRGAARLDPEAVQAILNLVTAGVPGLRAQNVAIIDNRGTVLVRAGVPAANGAGAGPGSADDIRQAMELRLSHEVEDMLDASLGPDKVRAEAAVTLDQSQVNETEESYNPDQQVLRSQQTSTDKSSNTEAAPPTTVSNNLPNADAGRSESGSREDKQQETSNYEIGKTVRTLVDEAPRVKRLSLAVLVDGTSVTGKTGTVIWQPRSQQELDRITQLVKSAVGFDAARGDSVTVETMRFTPPDDGGLQTAPAGFMGVAPADILRLGQTAMLALVVLGIALFVFRPMIRHLAPPAGGLAPVGALVAGAPGGAIDAAAADAPSNAGSLRAVVPAIEAAGEQGRQLVVAGGRPGLRSDGTGADPAAASVAALSDLVDRHPEESIALVRAWLAEEAI